MQETLKEMIKRIIKQESTRYTINEAFQDDMKFVVYSGNLKLFMDELKKHKLLKLLSKQKDGGYYNIKIANTGPADVWNDFIKFYKNRIKI